MDKSIDVSKEAVSLEEGRSGHSDESTEKRTSRKKRQGQKRRLALTVKNVVDELKEVDWITLCGDGIIPIVRVDGILQLHDSQRIKIEKNFVTEDGRRTAAVSFFLNNHPYASWRLLIWILDKEEKHSLSERLHPYAEKLTDPSLTHENVSVATASVEEDKLCRNILWVPWSKREEIRLQASNFRESVINYFALYSPYASWTWLAGQLYYWEEHEALSAVKKFIKGTREPTLTLPNLNTLLGSVSREWHLIAMWMNIPWSKHGMIMQQHSTALECCHECGRLYLTDHPSPTWQQVAYTLYRRDRMEELQVVQRNYLKGTAENHRQFEEAMKNGYIKAWLCKLLMYGAAGSGKTCTKEMIVGNSPPADRASTSLECRPTTIYQVNDEFTKISNLQEGKVFLARALNNMRLNLVATRHDNTSSLSLSTIAESPAKSKGRASAKVGKPSLLDDQPPPLNDEPPPLDDQTQRLDDQPPPLDEHPPPLDYQRPPLDDQYHDQSTPLDDQLPPLDNQPPPMDDQPPPLDEHPPPLDNQRPPLDDQPPPLNEHPPPMDDQRHPLDEHPLPLDDQRPPLDDQPPPLDDQTPPSSLTLASVCHVESTVIDILESISMEEELVKLMDSLSTTARKHQIAIFKMLRIIDCGGRPPFHELLPVFLRKLSFYLFVFRLCDELATHPVVEYYADGKPFGSPFVSAQSLEQLLQHCVGAMHSHRPSTGSERECPQIMVIGTHADQKEKSKETVDEKNRKILKILSPLARQQIIFHNALRKEVIFPVNAKAPGKGEDEIVKQIRRALLSSSSVRQAEIPSKWFALEILLKEMVQALQRGVLSKDEVITAAVQKLHFEEDEVDAALHYLDQLSVLFYYPQMLPGVVFADTQVLLDNLSQLVFKSAGTKNPSSEQSLSGEWIVSALVTAEFLSKETFSQHYVPGLFEVEDLILLFKKLLIFATFANGDLFVPALLRHLSPKDVDKHRVSSLPSLVLRFPDGSPRQGIFCALLCWLLSPENDSPAPWTVSVDEYGTPSCLYRNCVELKYPNSPVKIVLIDTYTHFEVHVSIPKTLLGDLGPKLLQKVRKAIFDGLSKASLNLGYTNSTPTMALVCPCGVGEAHVATVDAECCCWYCTVNEEEYGKLLPEQLLWLEALTSEDHTLLTESHLPLLLDKLKGYASKWRGIGLHLGFRTGELDNIQARPLLQLGAPESWLGAMLTEWLQRAPNNCRGSSTIENLRQSLEKNGINLEDMF